MVEEMESLSKNKTWVLVDKPRNKKIIGCKWVYKRKPGIVGVEPPRFKARLVAKGFSQVEGIDYHEVFSPVVKHTSIRVILSITAIKDLELEQLDVKTTFLHGMLEEEILMQQPEGFLQQGSEEKVCLLKRSLYGLKQSPRQWYFRFDEYMLKLKFQRSRYDSCVYYKILEDKSYIYLLIYVDDMLIACKHRSEMLKLKKLLNQEFDMKELGPATRILGMEISRDRTRGVLALSQEGYVNKIVELFGQKESRSVNTPIGAHFKLKSLSEEEASFEEKKMLGVPYSNAVGIIMYSMI